MDLTRTQIGWCPIVQSPSLYGIMVSDAGWGPPRDTDEIRPSIDPRSLLFAAVTPLSAGSGANSRPRATSSAELRNEIFAPFQEEQNAQPCEEEEETTRPRVGLRQ